MCFRASQLHQFAKHDQCADGRTPRKSGIDMLSKGEADDALRWHCSIPEISPRYIVHTHEASLFGIVFGRNTMILLGATSASGLLPSWASYRS